MARTLLGLMCLAVFVSAGTCARIVVREDRCPPQDSPRPDPPRVVHEKTELMCATVTDKYVTHDYCDRNYRYFIVVTIDGYCHERAVFEMDRCTYDCTTLYSKMQVWRTERVWSDGRREVIIQRR